MTRQLGSVLIFGASRGIGRALALEFARGGSRLLLCSRDRDALGELTEEIHALGGEAQWMSCDVAIAEDVRRVVGRAVEIFGKLDCAVMNSGVGAPEWMKNFTTEKLRRSLDVNVIGIGNAFEHLIPVFSRQGGGVFAGVTSLADVRGYPGSASYCAGKAAASRLLESARVELKQYGIDVVTIRPGFVRTDMTAKNEFTMPFLMEPRQAAQIIRQGLIKGKRFIQFPGPIVWITRLIHILPARLFDILSRKSR